MLFSIIIPAYNAEKYLPDCLDSVNRQTFRDFETIIVDDGSTDATGLIADGYASTTKNALVLHGENHGPLLARRKGLKNCHGEYVVLLDADDALKENALEKLKESIDSSNADIVSFRFSDKPDFSSTYDVNFLPVGNYDKSDYTKYRRIILLGLSNTLCGKAIRFSCFDLSDSYESFGKLMYAEDLFQALPVVDSANSFARIDDILYFYRQNEASSTACFRASYIRDIERVAVRILEYGGRWNMPDDAVRGSLRLYVNLAKILADSVDKLGLEDSKDQLVNLQRSLSMLDIDIKYGLKLMRLDRRCLLRSVLSNRLEFLRAVTKASHLGRRILGRSF